MRKTMVVGDVHGQVELLSRLMRNAWSSVPDLRERRILFIGDLVDRGEDPRGALSFILGMRKEGVRVDSIMGNHEYVMLCALGLYGEDRKREWAEPWHREFSSGPTFLSYGVAPGAFDELAKAVPPEHVRFLKSLPWCVEMGGCLAVHAGLLPGEPFRKQMRELRRRDGVRGRSPWLHEQRLVCAPPPPDCPLVVVSGHVRQPRVVMTDRRILLDTTGGKGGVLSAVLLPEREVVTS